MLRTKVIEEYHKNSNNSSIQFLQDERFFIHAQGTDMDLEETWDAIKKLDVEDLG